jgi:hypothetical protein
VIKSITNMGQVSVTTTEETQWQTEWIYAICKENEKAKWT